MPRKEEKNGCAIVLGEEVHPQFMLRYIVKKNERNFFCISSQFFRVRLSGIFFSSKSFKFVYFF